MAIFDDMPQDQIEQLEREREAEAEFLAWQEGLLKREAWKRYLRKKMHGETND